MTLEEAQKVASVLAQADGGCSHCAMNLAREMENHFPSFDWEALVRKRLEY